MAAKLGRWGLLDAVVDDVNVSVVDNKEREDLDFFIRVIILMDSRLGLVVP